MLRSIHIKNVALIDEQTISFDNGLSVLSGETGAGKSIIIESFNFVLGERASKELIQYGSDRAVVEATFDLAESDSVIDVLNRLELSDDLQLVLYRELNLQGKNNCRINGIPVTTQILKQVGDLLVDIHGQHAHQSLLNPKMHIDMLDAFASARIGKEKISVRDAFQKMQDSKNALHNAQMNERERAQKIDLYRYQIQEIENAKLIDGEEERLETERNKLSHAQTIIEAIGSSAEALSSDNGVLSMLSTVRHCLESISAYGEQYASLSEKVNDCYFQLEDASYELRDDVDSFSYNPKQLDEIENRMELIAQLKRKYGNSVREILEYYDKISIEFDLLSNAEQNREKLESNYRNDLENYIFHAEKLHELRIDAGRELSDKLLPELEDLGMPGAAFEVNCEKLDQGSFSVNGFDSIEFMLSANRGEPVKPLAHVASGGEISRIMLAFKTVLSKTDSIPTMVFDEIDSGVSGQMAFALGEKMQEIATDHQVLCITHLAQIAAYADQNYLVQKNTEGNRTVSKAIRLDQDMRITEIARMIGGEKEDMIAIQHAKSLIEKARRNKRNG